MEEMAMVGNTSGCLKVVAEYDAICDDLNFIIRNAAEKEWKDYLNGNSNAFVSFYSLNKKESEAYCNRDTMPDSFVQKYLKHGYLHSFITEDTFLWHKKSPDTYKDLLDGCSKKQMIKVQCQTCGRLFYTDITSFNCVRWRSCIGVECAKSTIQASSDYANNLYRWQESENAFQVANITGAELALVDELVTPLTYYGLKPTLKIAYISDIHLLHHLHLFRDEKHMINSYAKTLYDSADSADIVLFGGDTSSNADLTLLFYSAFMRCHDYQNFIQYKSEMLRLKKESQTSFAKEKDYCLLRFNRLNIYIDSLKKKLATYLDYDVFDKYHKSYRSYDSSDYAFDSFIKLTSYKNLKISKDLEPRIKHMVVEISRLSKVLEEYKDTIDRFEYKYVSLKEDIARFTSKAHKSIKKISLADYRHEKMQNVFAVLGNHEYLDFDSIEEAVDYYRQEFNKIGINLLHNESVQFDNFTLFGGTGFAKYDSEWNAETICCCNGFSREDEIRETELFETAYNKAFKNIKKRGKCLLCVSHYPISSCLNNHFDNEVIYFTGHNHRNEIVKSANRVMYSDNQIGYNYNETIIFKIATTGFETNPYANLEDGLFMTSVDDYLQFYRYIGENIGNGSLLYQRCNTGKANMYVVKRKGFYGFFIVSHTESGRGISIVNGGKTSKLTNSTDIAWICQNFEAVLIKYIRLLLPLRKAQNELSKELQDMGLDGKIHGCIVDIDFYHHIMINPKDGSCVYYYSPIFGEVQELNSFSKVIDSLAIHNYQLDIENVKSVYLAQSERADYLLNMISNGVFIETSDMNSIEQKEEIYSVSRSEGAYGVSRKVSPLQRIFTGHVLRDFDLRLAMTEQASYRKYSYVGRRFAYKGTLFQIVKDDGKDILYAREIENVEENAINDEIYSIDVNKLEKFQMFTVEELRKEMARDTYGDTRWISYEKQTITHS